MLDPGRGWGCFTSVVTSAAVFVLIAVAAYWSVSDWGGGDTDFFGETSAEIDLEEYSAEMIACVDEESRAMLSNTSSYRALPSAYQDSLNRADLAFFGDGKTALFSEEWAERSGELLIYLQEDLENAHSNSALPSWYYGDVITAHERLARAWLFFKDANEGELSDEEFDSASQFIFAKEQELSDAAGRLVASRASEVCEWLVE